MPFFSVIIPTYNRAGLLRKALASISRQQFRDFEIVVVDDGSTDDTEAVVRSSELPVSFLHQTNAGPGAARNLGIAHAQGHYVVFLDSDDQWLPWTLETYRCVIASQEKPTFMSGISLPLKEENADSEMKAGTLDFRHYPSLLVACNDRVPPVGGTPSICLERQALLKIGGFTGRRINGEDIDMWLRLGDSPGFVRILNPPVFLQRVHDGNVTHQIEPGDSRSLVSLGARAKSRVSRRRLLPLGTQTHHLWHGSQRESGLSEPRPGGRSFSTVSGELLVEFRVGQLEISRRLSAGGLPPQIPVTSRPDSNALSWSNGRPG